MITSGEVIEARNRANWSQSRLAAYLGIDVKTLGDFERGVRPMIRKGRVALEQWVKENTPVVEGTVVPTGSYSVRQALEQATDLDLISALSARLSMLRGLNADASTAGATTGHSDQDALLTAIAQAEPSPSAIPAGGTTRSGDGHNSSSAQTVQGAL